MDASTWELLLHAVGPLLLGAIAGTIPLTLISFVVGLVIALAVALARLSSIRVLGWLAGGYISVNTGSAPDGNAMPVAKPEADAAMDAAECIGCGACVAACKNSSAMLFVGAKITHLARLPQGQPERRDRVRDMVEAMDREGFGNCTNQRECEAVCPKEISVDHIAQLNRDFLRAQFSSCRCKK